jgi:AcrR family transcriptional regulator
MLSTVATPRAAVTTDTSARLPEPAPSLPPAPQESTPGSGSQAPPSGRSQRPPRRHRHQGSDTVRAPAHGGRGGLRGQRLSRDDDARHRLPGAGLSAAGVYVHFASKEDLFSSSSAATGHAEALRSRLRRRLSRVRRHPPAALQALGDGTLQRLARRALTRWPASSSTSSRTCPRSTGTEVSADGASGSTRPSGRCSSAGRGLSGDFVLDDLAHTRRWPCLSIVVDVARWYAPVRAAHPGRDRSHQCRAGTAPGRPSRVSSTGHPGHSGHSGHSALVVPVPALEEWVKARHEHYDRAYASDDPSFAHAHITLLAPFLASDGLATASPRIEEILSGATRSPSSSPPSRPSPTASSTSCPIVAPQRSSAHSPAH